MLTYGFYNSKNHDRQYDAIQMSSIFDGIVRDGIFMSIGKCFNVKADSEMTVLVDTGRAWFNHTWTLNDSVLPIEIPQSEVVLNRIDAVVIEVNAELSVRANSIKVVKGTPATNPVRPTLINTNNVHQYPLAYITVNQRVTSIRQADITNMVGTSQTPYVTGILQTVNIDNLVAQWEDQWRRFFENMTSDMTNTNEFWKAEWENWYNAITETMQNDLEKFTTEWQEFQERYSEEMKNTGLYWKELWETWFYAYVNDNSKDIADWKRKINEEFMEWWNSIRAMLDENCCSKLAYRLTELEKRVEELEDFRYQIVVLRTIWEPLEDDTYTKHDDIQDSSSDYVIDNNLERIQSSLYNSEFFLDSDGNPIEFRSLFK